MGLFSGISKAVGAVTSALSGNSWIGPAISAASSLIGGNNANRANMDMFESSQAFNKEAMQNKYQWQVDDLRAAGLNPALAYGQAPSIAGSPGGNAQNDAVTPAINTAMQKSMNDAMVHKTQADTTAALATAKNQESQANYNSAAAAKVAAETPNVSLTASNIQADTALKQMQYFVGTMEAQLKGSQNSLTAQQEMEVRQRIDLMKNQMNQIKAEIANRNSLTSINNLSLPRLRNEAAAEETWWKQNVSPFNKDISTMSNSASGALDMVGKMRGFKLDAGRFKLDKDMRNRAADSRDFRDHLLDKQLNRGR